MRAMRILSWLSGILVICLGGAAFALSFDNLQRLALAQGITPGLTWLWPLCLDFVVVVASLTVLRASLMNERSILAWILLFAFTAASVLFNVVTFKDWLTGAVHGLPALVNFLAIELLTGQLKSGIKRSGAVQSLHEIERAIERQRAELNELERKADETERLNAERLETGQSTERRTVNRTPNADKSRTLDVLLDYLAAHPNASLAQAGAALGRSKSTVKLYADELLNAGRLRKNGKGWEVAALDTSPAAH